MGKGRKKKRTTKPTPSSPAGSKQVAAWEFCKSRGIHHKFKRSKVAFILGQQNKRCGKLSVVATLPHEVVKLIISFLGDQATDLLNQLLCKRPFYYNNQYDTTYILRFSSDRTFRMEWSWCIFTSGSGDNEPGGSEETTGSWCLNKDYNILFSWSDPNHKSESNWSLWVDKTDTEILGITWHFAYNRDEICWQLRTGNGTPSSPWPKW
ncbi:hypothetical protein Pelo_12897 [Pelomyxa schiedti]|nr:hypothetical protein Pelo_12897 [Pelomyxa schiedti]